MIRLFVGLEIPDRLGDVLTDVAIGLPGARWIEADNLHLTLRFIGEVDEGTAADIDEALGRVHAPAVPLKVTGLGLFGPDRKPRALWAAVERDPALLHLHQKVESAVVRAGQPPEGRKFVPHITLAKLRQPHLERLGQLLSATSLAGVAPETVGHFTLFSSALHRDGADYTAERTYPLGAVTVPAGSAPEG